MSYQDVFAHHVEPFRRVRYARIIHVRQEVFFNDGGALLPQGTVFEFLQKLGYALPRVHAFTGGRIPCPGVVPQKLLELNHGWIVGHI